jgi:hypothetical protein
MAAAVSEHLEVFLTAYDPSDLPGGSIDPLGFERGYLFLADKILPGLTNVAQQPRYFSVLCAGVMLSDVESCPSPRAQYQHRLESLLRFERFWALANVLSSEATGNGQRRTGGIRGVTYAAETARSLLAKRASRTSSDFRLLSRQVPYGVVGIYAAVADGMRFLDRKSFTLTPDLGERLAEVFLKETDCPRAIRKAVRDDGDVAIGTLREWGERAHISGQFFAEERECFCEALNHDPVRARMAAFLEKYGFHDSDDTELKRMQRLEVALARDSCSRDLWEALSAILAYEDCYKLAMLAFERLLWLCRKVQGGAVRSADVQSDSIISIACERLPTATKKLVGTLDSAESEQFRTDLHRLDDTRRFLESASAASVSRQSLVEELLSRHTDVQRGKFDRGRRKMPWLEKTGGRVALTTTRVGGLHFEATEPENIAPHPYRFASADALIAAASENEEA